ncbi:flavin-dependent dehydrogenase [Streptosporangium album]|uniref:Flavin-dependent dehydrogenase n=1 Tax=Streptosporangium album TaxID=47479 RepID=A0A7W7WE59_9ACTN|nr:hypothetical protein [Streptosporangium album]MBB4943558.1 flavin-dependent dehydrogenase [Streptosporangium album]
MQKGGWPAYVWSFPIGDGTANVGFGMLLSRLRATGLPGRQVLHGRLAELLPQVNVRDLRAHRLPLSPGRPTPGARRCSTCWWMWVWARARCRCRWRVPWPAAGC